MIQGGPCFIFVLSRLVSICSLSKLKDHLLRARRTVRLDMPPTIHPGHKNSEKCESAFANLVNAFLFTGGISVYRMSLDVLNKKNIKIFNNAMHSCCPCLSEIKWYHYARMTLFVKKGKGEGFP